LRWLEQIAQRTGIAKGSVPSLSTHPSLYLETWRWHSMALPVNAIDEVAGFLEEEATQFGEQAFLQVGEDISLLDPFGERSIGYYLFGTIDQRFHPQGPEREAFKLQVLAELRATVHGMEAGGSFDTFIEPVWLAKNWVSFTVFQSELDDPVAWQILSNRARLVRLLKWPGHFHLVASTLNDLPSVFTEMSPKIEVSYDMHDELTRYMEEMQAQYPVLMRPVLMNVPK